MCTHFRPRTNNLQINICLVNLLSSISNNRFHNRPIHIFQSIKWFPLNSYTKPVIAHTLLQLLNNIANYQRRGGTTLPIQFGWRLGWSIRHNSQYSPVYLLALPQIENNGNCKTAQKSPNNGAMCENSSLHRGIHYPGKEITSHIKIHGQKMAQTLGTHTADIFQFPLF